MKRIALVLSIMLVAVLVFACSSTTSPIPSKPATSAPPATTAAAAPTSAAPAASAASSEPIKIGSIFGLTGETTNNSPYLKAALEYRLEQVGYQVAGRKIQLIIEDDASNPVTGTDKARKLLQSDKVDVMLGPIDAAVAAGVANYLTASKMPELVFMPSPATLLTLGGGNVYLPFGTLEGIGYYLGQYAYDKLGYKTALVMYEDFVAGQQFTGGAAKAFQAKGGTIIQTTAVKMGTLDFSPYLSAIKQADCVLFWFTSGVNQRFVTQYYEAGLKMPLLMPNSAGLLPPILKNIGDKAIGILGTQSYTSLLDTDLNKAFVTDFTAKKNLTPTAQVACADLSVTLFLEAVKATGGDTSYSKINDALHKVKVTTPAGTFSFASNGLGIGDLYITKVVKTADGAFLWGVVDKVSQVPFDVPSK